MRTCATMPLTPWAISEKTLKRERALRAQGQVEQAQKAQQQQAHKLRVARTDFKRRLDVAVQRVKDELQAVIDSVRHELECEKNLNSEAQEMVDNEVYVEKEELRKERWLRTPKTPRPPKTPKPPDKKSHTRSCATNARPHMPRPSRSVAGGR